MANIRTNVLSKANCAACQRAIAAANEALPYIEILRRVADVYPFIAERVDDLATRRQYLLEGAQAALEADHVTTATEM